MTADQILAALGGYAEVAKITGFPVTTVHSWKRIGFIPEWRRPDLIRLAERKGVRLTASDFPSERPTPSSEAA